MSRRDNTPVSIKATVTAETENAWLLDFGGAADEWVPKSLVRRGDEPGTFVMPEWLAEQRGMI